MRELTEVGKWPTTFLKEAILTSERSKDSSTKVGAVIVNKKKRIVATGYNGFPRGCADVELNREQKLFRTLHAELNAILFAGQELDGCTLYVTAPCCSGCMAAIIQVGITTVICLKPEKEFEGRWLDSCREAEVMAKEAGLGYFTISKENL